MNKVYIRVSDVDKLEISKFLIKKNIYYKFIKNINKRIFLIIYEQDYETIKRKYKKTFIIKYYGKKELLKMFKKNKFFILSIIWGLLILYFLSNTIFSININTTNNELKEILINDLEEYDIKKYGRIKSYRELNKIKKEIIKKNTDSIEWLEIHRNGTYYEVLLTERIIINPEEKQSYFRHIISSKDALIKHIVSSSGDVIKEINDYVKKGEIIISGSVYKNDKLITNLRADGKAFGEVWYIVKTSVPFKYVEYVKTGKVVNHYYLDIFDKKMTLIGKYDTNSSMNNKTLLINKPYLGLKLYKEEKVLYKYKEFEVTKEEAQIEAINRSDKGIKNKLSKGEYIIDKKVLNISSNSSKIELEIFYKVYENITDELLIEGSDIIEERNAGYS